MTKPILIVVDDDPDMALLIKNAGEMCGYDVRTMLNARTFQKAWEEIPPAIIVMDLVMPDMDGVELLQWLSQQNCSAPIILISGFGDRYLKMAEQIGSVSGERIVGTLTKPFKIDDLEALLNDARALLETSGGEREQA